jgi:tetratricopeptide (TPR) repeat protein/nucleoside phosphorylase
VKPKSTEGGRSRVYNAPARDPVQGFFGRETDLEGIESGLQSSAAPRVAIEGLAGVGKTELALQVVYRLEKTDRYPGGIFWLDAATPALDAVWGGDVADALDVPSGPVAERARQVIRRLEAGDQALVVLDNVESWTGDERPAPLPRGPSIHLLVTTQHQGLGGPNVFRHHDLRFLGEAAARAMLLSLSGRDGAAEPGLDALLNHLGGHTLALELAGAYLATYPSTTAGAYLARLQAGADPEADVTPQVAYARTVEQSLDAIWERLDDDARRAWQIAGVFAPAEATVELLTACDVDEATQRTLRRHHVISLSPTRWSMHRLVRAYGARAGTCEDRAAAEHTFLDAVLTLVRVVDAATGYRVYRENLPQLDHALDLGATALESDVFAFVLDRVGTGAQSAGDLLRAKQLLERALAVSETQGDDHPSVATRRSNLALVHLALGELARANELLESALALDIKHYGEWHEKVATRRTNLASVRQERGDLTGARELFEQALRFSRATFGDADLRVAKVRMNLGLVLKELGDLAVARELHEQALATVLRELGPEHPYAAACMSNLGTVLQDLGDQRGAKPLHEEALASDLKRLGEDHPTVAIRRSNLGTVLHRLGDLDGAKGLLEKALASELANHGDHHPYVPIRRSNLAGVLRDLGDLVAARKHLELAVDVNVETLGDEHPRVASSRSNLALVLADLGDLPRAKELLEQAVDAAQEKLGDEHPNVVTYRENLAEVVKRMNAAAAAAAVAAVRTESKEPRMTETHDVFICHASEDKARFVEPLVAALVGHGLRVWYDRFEIGLGDDVRGKMNEGLRGSRFGVVLVSPSSFKFWPQAELSALFNQEARGTGERPRILPVRCDLSVDELTARDPLLAGRRSIGWEEGLDAVARAIVGVVERARAGVGGRGDGCATSTPPRPAIVAPVTPGSPPVPTSPPATAPRSGGAAGRLDLGLVIALPEELRQVLALVGDYTRHPSGDLDAYLFTRNGYRCAAVLVGEMGQTQAGVFTERFIAALDPAMIVSMGIAGGLNDLCAGDVHVPSQSVEYLQDAKAAGIAGGGFAIVPGAPAYRVDYALLRAARALEFDHPAAFRAWRDDAARDLAALLPDADKRAALLADRDVREEVVALADGHVATGPVVGAARAFADWIRSHDRNVKSLEMEASAVVLAATTRPDPRRAFILRAISDLGDERKKELDGKSNGVLRRWAMNNAVRYLWTLLDVGALPRATPAGTTDA